MDGWGVNASGLSSSLVLASGGCVHVQFVRWYVQQ